MHSLAIVLFCVVAAVAYGVTHDQITARVCVEYFTVGHPPVFDTHEPTLLAFGWGVIATWWVGVLLGVPLAVAARAGRRLPRTLPTLVRPVGLLLAVMAGAAAVAGVVGWLLAREDVVYLIEPLRSAVPRDRHPLFLADLWAHSASYLVGFVGGLVVIVQVWRSRSNRPVAPGP